MSKTLFVGIDAHSKTNSACFMDQEGNVVVKSFSFPNNLPGAQELEQKIISTMQQGNFTSLKIATESASFYDLHLVDFLATSENLAPFSPEIYQFNPKLTSGFKKAYADKDKTDDIDAFVIADRLRFGRLPKPYSQHQPYLPLRRLTRYRFHLVEAIWREKNYFLIHLFLKYSSFSALKPFSNTFGSASTALILEDFSLDELVEMPVEDLVTFVMKHGHGRFENPQEVAEIVKRVARESYRIRPALASSVNLILAMTLQNIRTLSSALKEVNEAIAKEFKAFPNTLESVDGLGPVYSAGIFAEIGNIDNFHSQAGLAKFAGLTWRKSESGNFKAEVTRMTKTGNKYLRYYLIEAANSLRVHNEEYKAYYQAKLREVTKHRHKRAVALTARKLVRLIFSLLKNGQLYRPAVERSVSADPHKGGSAC